MLTDSTNNMVSCIDKAGDWPPLVTLMSKNSNVEQLQSDIAEWFRENPPDAYELPGPPSASKLGCESGLRSDNDGNTPGESQSRANCRIFWMLCGACHLQGFDVQHRKSDACVCATIMHSQVLLPYYLPYTYHLRIWGICPMCKSNVAKGPRIASQQYEISIIK